MGDPRNLAQAEEQMKVCIARLEAAIEDFSELCGDAAQAKHAWEMAEAKELLLTIDMPELKNEALRKAWVLTRPGMDELNLDYRLKHAVADSAAKRITALGHEADLLRSVAKGERDLSERHAGVR